MFYQIQAFCQTNSIGNSLRLALLALPGTGDFLPHLFPGSQGDPGQVWRQRESYAEKTESSFLVDWSYYEEETHMVVNEFPTCSKRYYIGPDLHWYLYGIN